MYLALCMGNDEALSSLNNSSIIIYVRSLFKNIREKRYIVKLNKLDMKLLFILYVIDEIDVWHLSYRPFYGGLLSVKGKVENS
jgi:hypothetical protein